VDKPSAVSLVQLHNAELNPLIPCDEIFVLCERRGDHKKRQRVWAARSQGKRHGAPWGLARPQGQY